MTALAAHARPDGWRELLAEDAKGGRVVLRVPPDVGRAEALRQEAELVSKHAHASIVRSVGVVVHEGWPVQVIEHVDGITLDALVGLVGPLVPAAVGNLGRQIAGALVELHQRPPVLCHGALGPDRVLIDDEGNARLVDVGVARPASTQRALSPERRLTHGAPSVADDLWALGVLLADAALGEAHIVDDQLHVSPAVGTPPFPERLADALGCLVAPAPSRVKNAAAALRIFTELEPRLVRAGEISGAFSLRDAMRAARQIARNAPAGDAPWTRRPAAEAEGVPTRTIAALEHPTTMVMEREALGLSELQRMAALGQEAAARADTSRGEAPTLPAMNAAPVPQPRASSSVAPEPLADEPAGLPPGWGKTMAAVVAIAAAMVTLAFVLSAWFG